jgi:hypothetical protein
MTDDERDQTFEESIKVYEKLSAWYESNGYKAITIPRVTIERGVDFILSKIPDRSKQKVFKKYVNNVRCKVDFS